jgi:hypothetical protein
VLGDGWSLLVLRELMFGNRRYFRELLATSSFGCRTASKTTVRPVGGTAEHCRRAG